jgi:hypothetical protein
MSASFYSTIDTNSRERISLAPGSYGTSKQAGLKIVAYIEKASKNDRAGNMRHSFLVSATRPSREQLQSNGNGKASAAGDHPLDAPDFEGTAFLSLTLSELWQAPESVALAFTEASRNKAGEIQADYEAKALANGDVTAESMQKARIHYQKLATDKVIAANTPEDSIAEAVKAQYRKELQQVSIKVGQFFQLQDWKNGGDKGKRNLQLNPVELVGVEFSGRVEKSNVGDQSEVTGIWSRS